MDKDGNDVFYLSLRGLNPGHYNIAKLSEILNKGTQNGVGTNSFK